MNLLSKLDQKEEAIPARYDSPTSFPHYWNMIAEMMIKIKVKTEKM